VIRLGWRPHATIAARTLNLGAIVAVLLASLAAGFMGGLIVWAVWRYDLLRLGDHRGEP
jgi:hypothetical protein